MEANGRSLVEHWNWAAKKGLMNKNTAAAWRAACTRVLGVVEDWERVDIRSLDVEATLSRFQNVAGKEFTPKSLEEYKRRFRQAVASYLAYVADPGSWKPSARQGKTSLRKQESRGGSSQPLERESCSVEAVVEYPFPLREGLTARLILPRDLKTVEVKRLNAFLMTLVTDSEN